jgi:Fe2+ or Zn2+ uptake regulation protein
MKIDYKHLEHLLRNNEMLPDKEIAYLYCKKYKKVNIETIRRSLNFLRNYLGIQSQRSIAVRNEYKKRIIDDYIKYRDKHPDKSFYEISVKLSKKYTLKPRTIYRIITDYEKYGIY